MQHSNEAALGKAQYGTHDHAEGSSVERMKMDLGLLWCYMTLSTVYLNEGLVLDKPAGRPPL